LGEGIVSESVAGTPPQDVRPVRSSTTSLEIVAESLSMLRQSLKARWGIWLVAAIFFTGTNIADIVFGTPAHPFQSPLVIASVIVRIVAYAIVSATAIRAFTNRLEVWSINLSLLRSALAFAALLAASMVLLLIVSHFITRPLTAAITNDIHARRVTSLIVVAVWLVIFGIVTVRLSPWIAALAVGDNAVNFKTAWQGMRGATLAAIGAVVWLSPVPLVHLAFTAQAQYLGSSSLGIVLTAIDGLVSVLQVMLAMAIAAVLYRHVSKNKPSP
jgi:hypothetical protein